MTEPRCDLSDLFVSQCAHCRKGSITLDDSREEVEPFSTYQEKQAKYPGTCVCGKRRFRKGDIIAWSTQDEWWRAKKCCPALFE